MTRVRLALENLEQNWPQSLQGCRLGLVLHPASVMPNLQHSYDYLKQFNDKLFVISALFGPQHGIRGELQDNMLESAHGTDAELQVPIWSLYSETRKPTPQMLTGLDALLIDLQDVGARYYTFIWTMYLMMQAAEEAGITVLVHDRPNPIGNRTEGPTLELECASFVGLWKIPVRHGLTIGQLARQFQSECFPNLKLHVLEMENYQADQYFEATGLPWVLPSPNMPTVDTAVVYPGQCLLEACNISEGRGTTRPFEIFGAPWMDSKALVQYLEAQNLPGLIVREHHFLPTFHKYASAAVAGWNDEIYDRFRGDVCHGAQLHVSDRSIYDPIAVTIEILRFAVRHHAEFFRWRPAEVGYEYEFQIKGIDTLLGSLWFREKFIEGDAKWRSTF